jgi:hypothetical protein
MQMMMEFQRWNVCLELVYFIEQMVCSTIPITSTFDQPF